MMWQLWTAFVSPSVCFSPSKHSLHIQGIMCGYIAGVVLQNVNAGTLELSYGPNEPNGRLLCDGGTGDLRSLRCVSQPLMP